MDQNTIFAPSEGFVMRVIAGDTILVPVGPQTKRLNGFITFTESGQFLWTLLSKAPRTADELVAALAAEYDAPEDVLRADVAAFLEKGLAQNTLKIYG